MARVLLPLHSLDARGSVAGIQFSRNRAGPFASRKSTSTYSQKPGSVAQRALFARASHAWPDVSAAHKQNWEALAPYPHTGRQLYIGCALRTLAVDMGTPIYPPQYDIHTSTLTNFRYEKPLYPYSHPVLWWDHSGYHWHRLLIYSVPLETHAYPHVRKFKFYRDKEVGAGGIALPELVNPNLWAIRILTIHPAVGYPLFELRWTCTADEDHVL